MVRLKRLNCIKPEKHPFTILDIIINQGVTMGSGDADPMLLFSSGLKECPPQVFRAFYEEFPCQTLQLNNTNCYI